jgi:hypothetical protein
MATAHSGSGGCGKETQQAGEATLLEGQMHSSSKVKERQKQGGHEIGQAATEALKPRTALIHG